MTEKRFKSRCYEKEKNVVIYDEGNKLFDVSYRDFEDAFYLKMKLIPVIDKLNELAGENQYLKSLKWNQDCINEISISMQQIQLLKKENKQLKQFKEKVFLLIDKRIRTLEANSKQCHQGWSHEKGIEFTLQAELLKRLKKELQE